VTPAEARAIARIWPDPEAEAAYWRRICRDMVRHAEAAAYEAGHAAGYRRAIGDLKRAQRGVVRDLRTYLARWDGRARERFGDPRPGDFPGYGAAYEAPPYPREPAR
jgi:hypothetical protein